MGGGDSHSPEMLLQNLGNQLVILLEKGLCVP